MSSHHIIREDQEPALLIMDTQAIPWDQIQELLEWSPTVLVSEHVVHEVLMWGIKIDVVISGADNVAELTALLHDQFPLKILSYNQPSEALSTALYFLIAKKQKAVTVLSAESLESFEAFSALDISVFQSGSRWSYIRSGHYEKWLPTGSTLLVYPAEGIAEINTRQDGVVITQRASGFWVSEKN